MGQINRLSDETINKIAAGEVIENPASVVKELVENAVDADAKHIHVEIRGGGLQLISVSDNGTGMAPAEALMALERHATSKISSSDDLFSLMTMGFRGEALASIAAISKITLITALGDGIGTRVEVEGGKVVSISPYARTRGTTIEVRSLFYNVPVRKKFQKSPNVCAADVTRVMTQLSLGHVNVGFSYVKQDEQVFQVEADCQDREKSILGTAFSQESYRIEATGIRGIVGAPLQSRPNRSGQYLFVNRRPIFSPLISFAVKDGYGTRIDENRHPIFVLHLEIDPERVDVNVHPQKREVRFQDEMAIKTLVREAVSAAFQTPIQKVFFEEKAPIFTNDFEPKLVFREEPPIQKKEDELPLVFQKPRSLGIYGHYFLVEDEGELLVVDLLAARAAVICAKVCHNKIDKQGLLFPETFEVSLAEADQIRANLSSFENVGLEVRSVGPRSFIVEAIPTFLDESHVKETILNCMHALKNAGDPLHAMGALLAKNSRRSTRPFTIQEGEALFAELKKNSALSLCPHGKPTFVRLSPEQMQQLF